MSVNPKPLCVLAGYFGYGNAGDELIHETLRRRIAEVDWVVLWPPEVPPPGGAATADRWDFVSLARLFRRARALVLGGGELFQARTSFRSLLYYVGLVFWAKLCGCEVWAFGLGVDPDLSPWTKRLVRRALASARGVWARDARTLAILGKGRRGPEIRSAPDPVWAASVEPAPPAPSTETLRVLWVLRSAGRDPSAAARMSSALNGLASRCPFEHGFLALHPDIDLPWLASLRAGLNFFHRLEPWGRTEELGSVFRRYDVVVSMRFHGIVLANLCGRPVVALSGHRKVAQLAEETGWPVLPWESVDAVSLERAVREAWERGGAEALRAARERGDAARRALSDMAARLARPV